MELVLDIGKKYPEITGPISDAFAAELSKASSNAHVTNLILDFSGTTTISSMAMGTIFSTFQRLKEQGRTLRIINASTKVTHLLRMVNMADMLT